MHSEGWGHVISKKLAGKVRRNGGKILVFQKQFKKAAQRPRSPTECMVMGSEHVSTQLSCETFCEQCDMSQDIVMCVSSYHLMSHQHDMSHQHVTCCHIMSH